VKKSMSLILILWLLFGLAVPTFAQEEGQPMVNCNGLSEADCQLLIDSAKASGTITSFTIPAMQGAFMLNAGEETLNAKVSGSAAMVMPLSLIAMASDMQGMQNLTDVQPIIDFYAQFTGEKLLDILAEMGLYAKLDELVVNVPGETPIAVSLEVIFKDMGIYLRVPSPTERDQWFGQALEVKPEDLAELDTLFEELTTQLESEEMQAGLAQISELEGVMNDFTALVNSYVVTTRGEDVAMMDQTMAVFTTTFDATKMIADPELPALLMGILENPALADLEMDPESVNEAQIQFLLMTAGMILKDVSVSSTQYIGLDDLFVHRVEVDAVLDVDLALMNDPSVPGLSGSAHFEADITDINSTTMDAFEVPTEYRSMDDADNFLVGSPSMIEGELTLGETFSGSFDSSDNQDVFALSLAAGQTVQIEIESDDYPYVDIYGPDGFKLAEMDTYFDQAVELTADEAGIYLVKVTAFWDVDYDLTIRVP